MKFSDIPRIDCPACDQPDTYEPVVAIHPGDRVLMRCAHCRVSRYESVADVLSSRADTEAMAVESGYTPEED